MTPLHRVVAYLYATGEGYVTEKELDMQLGDVTDELSHLISLGIIYRHGFDRRIWLKKPREKKDRPLTRFSAEKKIQTNINRHKERRAA